MLPATPIAAPGSSSALDAAVAIAVVTEGTSVESAATGTVSVPCVSQGCPQYMNTLRYTGLQQSATVAF